MFSYQGKRKDIVWSFWFDFNSFFLSAFGDSKLIKLEEQISEDGDFFTELESFANTGPIVDMCLMDLERQGQSQVVTCSGAYSDGSLRIIRSGIGVDEHANIEMPGIKGVWSLRASDKSLFDKFVVLSFLTETRVLAMEDGEEVTQKGRWWGKGKKW